MIQYSAVFFVTLLSAGCAGPAEESPFRFTTKRDDDKLEVTVRDNKAIISVYSPFGISQAHIERSDKNWPHSVALRLHLKGLEGLKISDGRITLEAAVSTQDSTVRLWKNGNEDLPLDSGSPYWMEIRLIDKDGKPVKGMPLGDGYFEIKLPRSLFEGNPQSITINWIDFYR